MPKISELDAVAAAAADTLPLVQGAATKKTTAGEVAGLASHLAAAQSGRYISPMNATFSATSSYVKVATNRLYAQPLTPLPFALAIQALCCNVTTGAAGNVRMGLYRGDREGPKDLIIDVGTASTASTGVIEITSAALTALTFLAEHLWAAAVFDAQVDMHAYPAASSTVSALGGTTGIPVAATGNNGNACYGVHVYGALPASFPTKTWGTAYIAPTFFIKV